MKKCTYIIILIIIVFSSLYVSCGKGEEHNKVSENKNYEINIDKTDEDSINENKGSEKKGTLENNTDDDNAIEKDNDVGSNKNNNSKESLNYTNGINEDIYTPETDDNDKPNNDKKNPTQDKVEQNEPEVEPTISVSSRYVEVKDYSKEVYVSISHDNIKNIEYHIGEKGIASCKWGDWNGTTIPLIITPLDTGETTITVTITDYDKSVSINVKSILSPPSERSSLDVVGLGKIVLDDNYNHVQIHSAIYYLENNENETEMCMYVDMIYSLPEEIQESPVSLKYILFNENGSRVDEGWIRKYDPEVNKNYLEQLYFAWLEPGNYILEVGVPF